jgi:hypothetical protein
MSKFVPKGYLSIREALNRLGRQLFPGEWIGDEYKARRDLISEDEWLKTKDLAPARGGDASNLGPWRKTIPNPAGAAVHPTGDPCTPSYQAEYIASKRYQDTRDRLHVLLEAGDLEAVIWDTFTGKLYPAPTSLWRQFYACRMIEKGEAPFPRSLNTGLILIKEFQSTSQPDKPLPAARLRETIDALKQEVATENLTREQQKDFVRKTFPTYHVTERQFLEIFKQVPAQIGRPKKPDTK